MCCSSDSEGHFDTPEAATPVHAPQPIPGELENNTTNAGKAGEAAAEQQQAEGEEKENKNRRRSAAERLA